MIYVYIYSILLHIMHNFTHRFLVLSESKADIRNPLSLLAYSAVKRTFAIRFRYLLMNAVALRPVVQMEHTSIDDDCDMPASVMFFCHKAFLT